MTTPRFRAFAWAAAFGLIATFTSVVQANSFEYENYVFHYNALRTDELPAESTQKAGIVRSRNRGMINLALRQKSADGSTIALPAEISASAVNLNNQYRELTLREMRDGDAIYYISDFPISGRETLRFQVNVLPEGAKKPFKVQFEKQFFTDP
ncbi:MAG TPA: DUF4426 domain-containing protein [Candidatus Acidoferrales bacterium]|nr:DUF4426 domain-containing protein [Candidatus Acidoferrales bacterium]